MAITQAETPAVPAGEAERILLLECRLDQVRTALNEARAAADRARARLAEAAAREADQARRYGLVTQELAEARAEIASLHERLTRSEALRAEVEGHLFEADERGDTAELVRLRKEALAQRERSVTNERTATRLRARVDELLLSRETLLARLAEWQRLVRRDGPEAVDLAEFIAELRRDILHLEQRNAIAERREAALRERLALAGVDPDAAIGEDLPGGPGEAPAASERPDQEAGRSETPQVGRSETLHETRRSEAPGSAAPTDSAIEASTAQRQKTDLVAPVRATPRLPNELDLFDRSAAHRTRDDATQSRGGRTTTAASEAAPPETTELPSASDPNAIGPGEADSADSASDTPATPPAAGSPTTTPGMETPAGPPVADPVVVPPADAGPAVETTTVAPAADPVSGAPGLDSPMVAADSGRDAARKAAEPEPGTVPADSAAARPAADAGTVPLPADPVTLPPAADSRTGPSASEMSTGSPAAAGAAGVPGADKPTAPAAGDPVTVSSTARTTTGATETAAPTTVQPEPAPDLAWPAPVEGLGAPDPATRAEAYERLSRILGDQPSRLADHLRSGLTDPHPRVRRRTVLAAATVRRLALRPLLDPLRADPDPQVRRVVREVLRHAPPDEPRAGGREATERILASAPSSSERRS